ncbi:DinB family protein [Luteococcus peritonei]|uniref:DinB family protein n=1 Tax=Luteococcus peritonei TaxID=88874 RepID=A0ABW4RTY5_9ACTN
MRTDEQGRPEPPQRAGELETLTGFLDFHRATLAWKCSGLDATGLDRPLRPGGVTLGGMLSHLAYVEDHWFGRVLLGRPSAPPWDEVDWRADPDWDWHDAAGRAPDDLFARWQEAVEASREALDQALQTDGLDQVTPDGRFTLRWILVHMVEEYSRHNGHADLLREAVDGLTGD